MTNIVIDSHRVHHACTVYIKKHQKFYMDLTNEQGLSLLTKTEKNNKKTILTLLQMTKHANKITISSEDFNLIHMYLYVG